MPSRKVLLQIRQAIMADLAAGSETGMDFYIADSAKGLVVVLENRDAMPLYSDPTYFSLDDLLAGAPIPGQKQQPPQFVVNRATGSRFQALQAIQAALPMTISAKYVGTAGAIPLIATETLSSPTLFLRYISSSTDHRFNPTTNILKKGTYLTSQLDRNHADTGFGSVGRYALPLPIPVTNIIEYTLPATTVIDVGTVSPLFGQAGGGVEICLTADTVVTVGATTPLQPY